MGERAPKTTLFQNLKKKKKNFSNLIEKLVLFACASLFLVPGQFACTIGLYSERRFSRTGNSRLREVFAGAWIAGGTSSRLETESVIVIESESESVSAIENQATYAEKIRSGEVGWLSVFPDVLLYWNSVL